MAGAKTFIDKKILQRKIVLFSKSYSPECQAIKTMINEYAIPDSVYEVVEIEKRQDCTQMETYFQVLCLTNARAVPLLFVNSKYVGGEKELPRLHQSGELRKLVDSVCQAA